MSERDFLALYYQNIDFLMRDLEVSCSVYLYVVDIYIDHIHLISALMFPDFGSYPAFFQIVVLNEIRSKGPRSKTLPVKNTLRQKPSLSKALPVKNSIHTVKTVKSLDIERR